ncbi:MAG: fatty acid desaturase [Litoreibacter sp.]|uniref:fatty acid desaturase n=1 Tax=Litoreibacter sp. TaxID=1969459 RepID=UPI003299B9DF
MRRPQANIEWPTMILLVTTYVIWGGALFWVSGWSLVVGIILSALAIAQQSSLQHEVLHGHPTRWQWLNETLVCASLNLAIPYGRFRDTHLAHHRDANLTDPYDDPESNFRTEDNWLALPNWAKRVCLFNNTLAGRMLLGPVLGQWSFMKTDAKQIDRDIAASWGVHLATSAVLIWVVLQSAMPLWAYLMSVYLALSVLKVRTFLEHRAHDQSRARTVIIEDRGPLSLLFLNNNLHAVHHMHPDVPWYDLPATFRNQRDRYLACNEGYLYSSYNTIFARHFLMPKDPVAHPLWHRSKETLDG